MMILNYQDKDQSHKHRLLQIDRDGSFRCVGFFNNGEEAVERAAALNTKYPGGCWLYCPPMGWDYLSAQEGLPMK